MTLANWIHPLLFAGSDPYARYEVYDTFTDTDGVTLPVHTPDKDAVGGGWIALNPVNPWAIAGNKCVDPGAGAGDQYTVIDCGIANLVLELTGTIGTGFFPWTIFRNDGVNHNKSWFFMYHPAAGEWRLYKFDGAYLVMDSVVEAAPVGPKAVRVECNGNDVDCYVDDVLKCSATHAFNNDKTFVGPGANTPNDNYGTAEDFRVTAL